MLLILAISSLVVAAEPAAERVTYLRPAGDRFVTECTFDIQRRLDGWSITSTTERGKLRLRVSARYEAANQLQDAEAALSEGDQQTIARVMVEGGKAKVTRPNQPAQEFEVPPGVIVTSAPDWSDTFLLARRYDRAKGGKQEFPGLWIHPSQPAQAPRFSIEKVGRDTIDHDGKKIELDRCVIQLRGNSAYAAWIDAKGMLIRLIPLPAKEGVVSGLVLEGYQKSALPLVFK